MNTQRAGVVFASVGVASLVLMTAWLSDDAYITLRVVDNWWNGYGLRWNALERVQVFTHPLWMLILTAAYGVTREPFWTTLVVSTAMSLTTVFVVSHRIAPNAAAAFVALALIAGSKSIIEFSTSGLENPLSHLLLVGCLAVLWRGGDSRSALPVASFLAGLCVLCRLDLVLLIGPPLAAAMWRARRTGFRLLVRSALLATAPISLWWAFAFAYYGSIWPNTAFAKLPSNVGLWERLPQGLRYLADAAIVDPVTVIAVTSATTWAWWRRETRELALGLTAALCYVVAVGGDFMTGRFLSTPAVVAIAFLTHSLRWNGRSAAVAATATLALALAMPRSPLRVWRQPHVGDAIVSHGAGIVDERSVYAPYTSVIAATRGVGPSDHPWATGGRALALAPQVVTFEAVGLFGYHAGPGIHIVDPMALTDPLLARLPADRPWRVGHLRRAIPRGYVELLRACVSNAFPGHAIAPPSRTCLDAAVQPSTAMDPSVGEAYGRIAVITQLPLTDDRRLAQLRRGGL